MTFSLDYAIAILPALLAGAVVTIQATLAGFALAAGLGLLLAVARMEGPRALSLAAAAYVEFVRGTPILIQLFVLFYVLPLYGLTLDAFTTGALVLGLHFSTYASEVYRAGIEGVPQGQWEAAQTLNFSKLHTWSRIIIPQALPGVTAPLGNYLISMFKDSVVLATITVPELLNAALNEASRTFRYFEPLTVVGVIFLVMSYPASIAIRRLEARLARR